MLTLPINSQRVLAFGRLLSGDLGTGYQKKGAHRKIHAI